MTKLSFLALAAFIPGAVFALDFENSTGRYNDAPFSLAEAAGISVLTNIAAVQGNPDGGFAADRTLNRAEYTKIALLAGRMPPSSVVVDSAETCFPDVPVEEWFRPYVCSAKQHGVVQGNPDGLFHPERAVNYAEATKILVEIFGYELPAIKTGEDVPWYTPYMLAAKDKGVALPGNVAAGHELTRGEMARLAAAFVAESEGELEIYRAFERGEQPASSSSSSSSSSESSSSSSSESSSVTSLSSSSSQSSVSSSSLFPARGHFLVAGTTTPVLFDGVFAGSEEEDAYLRQVDLEFRKEIGAIESLLLVDGAGTVVATLQLLGSNNPDDTKWRADLLTGSYLIDKDEPVRLGIKAKVKGRGEGGSSNERVELETFSIRATGVTTGETRQIVPSETHYPVHQTAFGRILSVENDLGSELTVTEGAQKLLGTFTVAGRAASGSSIGLETLSFILQTTDVSVSNMKIGGTSPLQQGGCATETLSSRVILTCFVPSDLRNITSNPVTLNVYGDLSIAAAKQEGAIHLSSLGTGGVGSIGAVRWNDVSTSFSWIEGDATLESGPVVTVTK